MRRKIAFILIAVIFSCNTLITANAVIKKESIEIINRRIYKTVGATTSNAKKGTNSNAKKSTGSDASRTDRNITEVQTNRNIVCQVSFPASVHACLDPGNILGKGQVHSDSYIVENYGKNDVAIKIKSIQLTCELSEEIYEFSEEEIGSDQINTKILNIQIVWKNEAEHIEKKLLVENGNPNEYVLFLKGAKYSKDDEYISLNEGSKGSFYFTGTLSNNPGISWDESELSVRFDYEVEIEETDEE